MKRGLVISDAGPIISLAIIDRLEILNNLFEEVFIPKAVWEEVSRDQTLVYYDRIAEFFEPRVKEISGFNELTFVMDYGESESVILYKEMHATYLLIDDKKARNIAENLGIRCIGTIGILSKAREKNLIKELRPLFEVFVKNDRYYSMKLLNTILELHKEEIIKKGA